jgi:hypothetical protein
MVYFLNWKSLPKDFCDFVLIFHVALHEEFNFMKGFCTQIVGIFFLKPKQKVHVFITGVFFPLFLFICLYQHGHKNLWQQQWWQEQPPPPLWLKFKT